MALLESLFEQEPQEPQAIFDPEKIVTMIDQLESDRGILHDRMDRDMDRYHLTPFTGIEDEDGTNILDGYRKFTSNDPATTMNLALHLGSTAKRLVRVHQPRAQEMEREINNLKELFCLGIWEAADQRRADLLQPTIQDSIFGQSLFRGRSAQRCLLIRDMFSGKTTADVQDWDPRNVYWDMGPNGLLWACEKSYKSRSNLMVEYGIDPAENEYEPQDNDQDKSYAVYDFFDEATNCVIVEGNIELKKATPHGMPRVPVIIDLAETRPLLSANEQDERDYESHYGESFYRSSRQMFDEQNQVFSIISVLTGRSIKQPIIVTSRDGSLTLPEDPWVTGQETSLSTDEQQSIAPLQQMEMAREAGPFMGLVSSMMQRGTFPANLFGSLNGTGGLSGYALTQLRQGVEAPLTPHIRSSERMIRKIFQLFVDAYSSGLFDTMELSGHLQNPQKSFFYEQIPPQALQTPGSIEVELIPSLPQDDASKVNLVQMLRDGPGGVPLIDDRFAREMMDFQDVDQMEKAVWEQQAGRGSPLALAVNSLKAATSQGNQQMTAVWKEESNMAVMQKRLEMMMLMLQTQQMQMALAMGQPPGAAPGGPPSPGGPPGPGGPQQPPGQAPQRQTTPPSNVQPPEARGIQSSPGQQAGPNVPPGTPRPGAQGRDQDLAALGLFGPNG